MLWAAGQVLPGWGREGSWLAACAPCWLGIEISVPAAVFSAAAASHKAKNTWPGRVAVQVCAGGAQRQGHQVYPDGGDGCEGAVQAVRFSQRENCAQGAPSAGAAAACSRQAVSQGWGQWWCGRGRWHAPALGGCGYPIRVSDDCGCRLARQSDCRCRSTASLVGQSTGQCPVRLDFLDF
jgi:hypothetical protein